MINICFFYLFPSLSLSFGIDNHFPIYNRNYRSISEFFTRPLRPDVRQISRTCLISPVDGRVLHFGLATGEQIEQVKGISYSLESFIGPTNEQTEKIVKLNTFKLNDVSSVFLAFRRHRISIIFFLYR